MNSTSMSPARDDLSWRVKVSYHRGTIIRKLVSDFRSSSWNSFPNGLSIPQSRKLQRATNLDVTYTYNVSHEGYECYIYF